MAHDVVFYANRSTPLVVPAGGSTRGKRKPSWGRQTSRRRANAREERAIRAGRWVPGPRGRRSKIRPALYRRRRRRRR